MSAAEVRLSETIRYINDRRDDNFDRKEIPVRDKCYRKAFAEHPDDIRAVQFAYGFADFLQQKKILINEYDILAGNAFRYTYNTTLPISCPDDYDPHFRPPIGVDPMVEAEICIDYHQYPAGSDEEQQMRRFATAVDNWLFKHWESGHIIPGFYRVLALGYGGILKECDEAIKTADSKQAEFIKAMRMVCQASIDYIRRYEALALQRAAETANPQWKQNMERIAKACAQIAAGPATNFFEAVQLTWFAHELILAENVPSSESLGRMDQYLYPYYAADKEAGVMTYEEASDLIDALWIKFSANLHAYQNVTLGGIDMNGKYMENDLTFICLQATRRLRFDQPLISLRYDDSMSNELWEEAVALVQTGTGFPAFFSDDACIAAKKKMGLSDEDSYNYGLIGCVEMAAPGKEYAKTEVLRINWPKVLELMLNDGKCSISKDIIKPFTSKDLDSIESFEELYDWYKDELLKFSAFAMDSINKLDPMVPDRFPTPYLSITMEDCIQNGKDVTGGGTVYNNTGISACGMANAVDSLAAIKKLVFEDKKYTLKEITEAAYANFEGYDDMLIDISHCPKFGNDDDAVDMLLGDLVSAYGDLVDNTRNPRGGKFQLGLYSVEDHAKMGVRTGALPDGKLAAQSLANAISPVQGKDTVGPTAVINSVVKSDLSTATNGMVLDLKFNPKFFEIESHRAALRALINSFFNQGGMEIQFNVIDRATLVDAQNHPEKHKDLVVRVSGFSAYFTSLMKATQDEIIARTEYATM